MVRFQIGSPSYCRKEVAWTPVLTVAQLPLERNLTEKGVYTPVGTLTSVGGHVTGVLQGLNLL
jgi:hypothetical protein